MWWLGPWQWPLGRGRSVQGRAPLPHWPWLWGAGEGAAGLAGAAGQWSAVTLGSRAGVLPLCLLGRLECLQGRAAAVAVAVGMAAVAVVAVAVEAVVAVAAVAVAAVAVVSCHWWAGARLVRRAGAIGGRAAPVWREARSQAGSQARRAGGPMRASTGHGSKGGGYSGTRLLHSATVESWSGSGLVAGRGGLSQAGSRRAWATLTHAFICTQVGSIAAAGQWGGGGWSWLISMGNADP